MGKRNEKLALQYFRSYLQVTFTSRKILQHGASGFTSPLKEGVLLIFIALKKPLPQPGLNLQTLHQMASTLSTTPLKLL
jgi:hypothetical protein